jgi:hypothetical protein
MINVFTIIKKYGFYISYLPRILGVIALELEEIQRNSVHSRLTWKLFGIAMPLDGSFVCLSICLSENFNFEHNTEVLLWTVSKLRRCLLFDEHYPPDPIICIRVKGQGLLQRH